jgi:8-oxo-dGTP pyrophosphatase MutT (NUDIX family)
LREAIEELGLHVEHPEGGPRLIHLDVHEAALGHTHLDLRYLLLGAADDPHPPPGESPEARWYDWDEAASIADEALAPGLVVARAEWEALGDGAEPPGGGQHGGAANGGAANGEGRPRD